MSYLFAHLWFCFWCFITYDLAFSIQIKFKFLWLPPFALPVWEFFIRRSGDCLCRLPSVADSLRGGPQWSQPLVSRPCVIPSPSVLAGPSDSILVNRIQQKWWETTTEIRLYKHRGFHLGLPLLLAHCCWERRHCHVGYCPLERLRRWGIES